MTTAAKLRWLTSVRQRAVERDMAHLLATMATHDPEYGALWRTYMAQVQHIYDEVQERAEMLVTDIVKGAENNA